VIYPFPWKNNRFVKFSLAYDRETNHYMYLISQNEKGGKKMEWILYISVALIAAAFAVVSIFLVKALKSLDETLKHTAETVERLPGQIDGLANEATILLHQTNRLAEDIQEKTGALDSTFHAVKEAGDSLKAVNDTVKGTTEAISNQVKNQSDKITEAIRWGNTLFALWNKWQSQKKRKHTYNQTEQTYS
jgi:uncharacterized protein YoxC